MLAPRFPVYFKLTLRVRNMELILNDDGEIFGAVTIPNLCLQLRLRDPSFSVRVLVPQIHVLDIAAKMSSNHRSIVSFSGEDGGENAVEVSYKRYDDQFKMRLLKKIVYDEYHMPPPRDEHPPLIPERGYQDLLRVRVCTIKATWVPTFLRKLFRVYDGFFWEGDEMCMREPNALEVSRKLPTKRMEIAVSNVQLLFPDFREQGICLDATNGSLEDETQPETVFKLKSLEMFRDPYLPPHRCDPDTNDPDNYKHFRHRVHVGLQGAMLELRYLVPTAYFQRRPAGVHVRHHPSDKVWEHFTVVEHCDAHIMIDQDVYPHHHPAVSVPPHPDSEPGPSSTPFSTEESMQLLYPHKKVSVQIERLQGDITQVRSVLLTPHPPPHPHSSLFQSQYCLTDCSCSQ